MRMSSVARRFLPLLARDPREPGRAASSLQLFFDLHDPIAAFVLGIWVLALRRHGDAWVRRAVPARAQLLSRSGPTSAPEAALTCIGSRP